MLSKTKKLTKGGDNIGRIVIMEFKAQDSTAFDDMLAFVKQHPDFEKLEISYEPTLSLSGLEINLSRRRVINNGQEIELTVKEYDILCLLAANKGRVLTYEQIYDKVWGEITNSLAKLAGICGSFSFFETNISSSEQSTKISDFAL